MLKNYHKTSNKAGFTNISGCGVLERYPTKMLSRLYRLFGGQEDESMQNDSPPTNAAPFEPLPPTNASFSAANSDSSYATPEQKIALANAITGAKVTEFNPSQRMHIVVELYANAGRIFMSEEKWREAGDAFTGAADNSIISMAFDPAPIVDHLRSAAYAYERVDVNESIMSLQRILPYCTPSGSFYTALRIAKLAKSSAHLEMAIERLQHVAEHYKSEDKFIQACEVLLSMAQVCASKERYAEASDFFEKAAQLTFDCSENSRVRAPAYLLSAGLCLLVLGDELAISDAFTRYKTMSNRVQENANVQCLMTLTQHVRQGDLEAFDALLQSEEGIVGSDALHRTMTDKIRQSIVARQAKVES